MAAGAAVAYRGVWRQARQALLRLVRDGQVGVAMPSAVAPNGRPGGGFNAADPIPPAWRCFAECVQATFQMLLAGDDHRARRVRVAFQSAGKTAGMVVGSVWVTSRGRIKRLEIEGVSADLSDDMRTVLMSSDFGMVPPCDLPQPLRLRLRLSDDEPGDGQWGQ
jgi:hypothetical protein